MADDLAVLVLSGGITEIVNAVRSFLDDARSETVGGCMREVGDSDIDFGGIAALPPLQNRMESWREDPKWVCSHSHEVSLVRENAGEGVKPVLGRTPRA